MTAIANITPDVVAPESRSEFLVELMRDMLEKYERAAKNPATRDSFFRSVLKDTPAFALLVGVHLGRTGGPFASALESDLRRFVIAEEVHEATAAVLTGDKNGPRPASREPRTEHAIRR